MQKILKNSKYGYKSGNVMYKGGSSKVFYLVIVVLKVRILTLQLNHLQPDDPLLLFGSHEITVRIPALWFPTKGRICFCTY